MIKILFPLVIILMLAFYPLQGDAATAITGTLVDANDNTPIAHVTIQLSPSGKTSITNDDGYFRILPNTGDKSIKFTHVAYQSNDHKLSLENDLGTINLLPALHLIKGLKVYNRSYDKAQAIIIEAIRRKEEILSRINNYQNDSYLKFVVRDITKEDSAKILLITETQATTYWQYPGKYKEILTARKSTANIVTEDMIMAMGEMLNFNKNRLDLGESQVVSPTAKDALDYYNYYLLDTIRVDNLKRYVLEIEPKNEIDPLLVGTIHIVDSTYDVVMVDVGFTDGVKMPLINDLRYHQKMAQFDSTYWVPIEISFSGQVELKFPGIPSKMSFEFLASLYSFEFDQEFSDDIFDEYEFEVAETADDFDSLAWAARQTVPLSSEEIKGYALIDSVANIPVPLPKQILRKILGVASYHFNRVEGHYYGAGIETRKLIKNTRLWGGVGYSHKLTDWQYDFGFRTRVAKKFQLHLTTEIKDQITIKPSVTSGRSFLSSALVLLAKCDPFDYYREKGFSVGFDFKPIRYNRLSFKINSYDQTSVTVNNTYSIINRNDEPRINPEIKEGQLRSIIAGWHFDSRKMMNNKGVEYPGFSTDYFTLDLNAEHSSPDYFNSDFHYKRYTLAGYVRTRMIGSSETIINLTLGYSKYSLPPQRFFAVDFGVGIFMSGRGFNTIGDSLFFGDRIASVYVVQDLGRVPFTKVPIPVINKIPFGLMLHGGAFWSSFEDNTVIPEGNHRTAIKPYTEVGFTVTNLTPFIMPFNFTAGVTWQLSDYDTTDWQVHIGIKL